MITATSVSAPTKASISRVLTPMRAAASAASHPACPAPITRISATSSTINHLFSTALPAFANGISTGFPPQLIAFADGFARKYSFLPCYPKTFILAETIAKIPNKPCAFDHAARPDSHYARGLYTIVRFTCNYNKTLLCIFFCLLSTVISPWPPRLPIRMTAEKTINLYGFMW